MKVNVELHVIEVGGVLPGGRVNQFLTKVYELPGVPRVSEWIDLPHHTAGEGLQLEIRRVRWLLNESERESSGGASVGVRAVLSGTGAIDWLSSVMDWLLEEDGWKAW